MEKEKKIETAKQVFRKMLVDEYGIKSADQFFSTESEAMAEILHIPEHTRSLSGSLLGYKTIP